MPKNAPPPPAPSNSFGRACGSGSAAARPPDISSSCWRERVRAGLDVIAVPTSEATRSEAERLGVPLTTLDETPELDLTVDGADEIAPRSEPDQGRRRRAAAGEDRRRGLRAHDRHRRRIEMGLRARPLPAADRGGAVRIGGDAAGGRGRGRGGRLHGSRAAAADQGRPRFRHGWRALDSRRRARADRRIRDRSRIVSTAIAGVVEHGLFIGLRTDRRDRGRGRRAHRRAAVNAVSREEYHLKRE